MRLVASWSVTKGLMKERSNSRPELEVEVNLTLKESVRIELMQEGLSIHCFRLFFGQKMVVLTIHFIILLWKNRELQSPWISHCLRLNLPQLDLPQLDLPKRIDYSLCLRRRLIHYTRKRLKGRTHNLSSKATIFSLFSYIVLIVCFICI